MSGKSFRQFVNEGGFDQTIYNNWIKDVNSANESYNRYVKNSTTIYDKNHDLQLSYFDRLINRGNNIKKMLSSGAIKIGNIADVDTTLSHLNEMKSGINSVAKFHSQFENEDSFYDWSFNNKYSGKTLKEIDDYIKNYANGDTSNAKREYDWLVSNRDYFMSPEELQAEIKLLENKSSELKHSKWKSGVEFVGTGLSGQNADSAYSVYQKNKSAETENAARLDKLKKLYASHGDVSSEKLDALYKKADEKNIFSVLSPDYTYADYANDKADKNIYGSAYIQRKDQENLEIIQKHQDEFDSDVSAIESIISSRLLASDLASSATGGNILRGLNEGSRRKEIRATDPEILAIKQKWTDKGYDFDSLFETHERNSNTQYTEAVKNQKSEYAKKHPVLANIESVGTNLIGGISALPSAIGSGLEDLISDEVVTMDTNSPAWAIKNVTDSIRDTTSELLNTGEYGKFKAFLYQTGMSIADFSTTAVATGFAQPATLLLMGSNAAVDSMKTVTERGGSASDALTMGVLAGVFEAVMEKVPLDTVFKSVNTATGKAWIRNVFNGMMTEGFEELGTDLANNLVDILLNADQAEFNQNVFNYMKNGMSASEASAKVFAETAANMGLSFLGGAISGGGMTAVGGGIGLARADSEYKNIGNNIMSHEDGTDTVMAFAKELVAHDKAVANNVKKVEQKKSARNVGRLYADTQNALSEQNRTTYIAEAKKGIQARVEELGLDKSTSKAAADIIYKAYNGEKLTARQQKILKDNKYVARAYRELSAYNTQEGRENYTNSWVQTVDENIEKATSPISEKIATLSAYSRVSPEAESPMQTDTVDGMNDVMTEDALTPSDIDTTPAVINGTEDFTSFVDNARTEQMNSGVVKKYSTTKLNNTAEKQIAVLDAYGKKHGLSFIVVDSIGSEDSSLKANGAYIGKNKIMVSLDSEAGAILSVAGHEVYHYISGNNKSAADSIKSFVLDKLKSDSKYNYDERFDKLASQYGTEDVDTIEEEMVANAMFDILSDENVINGLAKENSSLLEKIITAIKDFVSELKNMAKNLPWKEVAVFQDDIQSLETIRAMAEAALWQINESGKNSSDVTNKTTKNTADEDGVVKYSYNSNQIYPDMSDADRAEVLRNTVISIAQYTGNEELNGKNVMMLKSSYNSQAGVILKNLGEKFGVFKNYSNDNIELEFNYSRGSLNESVHKQGDISTDFYDFAKMLYVFDAVVKNAVPIEVHTDKYEGTERANPNLKYDYVLLSAFGDGEYIIPVEFHIHEFNENVKDPNKLYVSITLGKIKIENKVKVQVAENQKTDEQWQNTRLFSEISIPQLIEKINPEYGNFYKYIPSELLDDEQIKSKKIAVDDEAYRLGVMRGEDVSDILSGKALEKGYDTDTSWRMDHKAPNAKYDVCITDIDRCYGGDGSIYSPKAAYYYGDGRSYDQKAINAIKKARKSPETLISIYRAVPGNIKDTRVRNGDWVSIDKEYAEEHGWRMFDDDYRIIENKVPAKYLYTDGNSIHEFGYDNRNSNEVYKNTENNVKLNEVTYDDKGILIPLSKRFDEEKTDIRFSLKETAEASENRENLIKANDNLRVANALLKKELKLTQGKMISYDTAKNIAKYLTSEYSSHYDTTRLSREIYNIFNHYDKSGDYEYLMDYLATIGRRVVEQSSAVDNTLYEDYEDARKWVRHMRFTLPEQVLNQMNENYDGKFVRKTFGRMQYVSRDAHPDAPFLSQIYSELAEAYPNFFSIEDNEYEQPMRLIEFWEKIQPTYYNPLNEMGYASEEDAAVGFAFDVFKAYSEADKLETFADKKRNEINNLRKEYNRNLDRVKKKMSAERDSRLEYQKEYYINAREKSYDGRKKAYVKKKIRNVIKDLDKYLNRGSKDKNVKEDLQETVQTALSTAELLFSEVPSNEDIVRAGVSSYTQREAYWLDEYEGLLKKRDDYRAQYAENNKNQMSGEFLETREKLNLLMDGVNKRMKYLDKCLEELFEREKRRLEQATVSEALSKLAATYSKIKDSEYSYIAQSYNQNVYDKIADIIDKKGNAKISLLSTKELDDIYVVYKMVLHTVRNANKIFTSEKKQTAEDLGKIAIEEISKIGKLKYRGNTPIEKLKKTMWQEFKPIYAFRFIGSDVLQERYAAMRNGEDTYYRDVAHAKDFYSSLRKKYKTDEWKLDKGYKFVSKEGDEFELTLEQIMSIYAYCRRDNTALTHLTYGGFLFAKEATKAKKEYDKIKDENKKFRDYYTSYSLSPETLAKINDVLDDNQRAYVEEMQKYLSDVMGNKGNEVSMKMYGVKLFNEKNYFPLKSADQWIHSESTPKGEASLKNAGFSKETTPEANNPIVLDDFTSVWSKHVQDMAMYHSFVLPIEDFSRVFNYETRSTETDRSQSLKITLGRYFGDGAENYISTLLTDLNSGVRSQSGSEFVNKLTGLAKKGAVFASMSVVIQQPSAVVRAIAHVNPKYFINALPKSANWLTVNKQYEELKKYAPVAGIKEMGYFDTGFGKSTAEWITEKEYRGFGRKLKAFVSKDGKYRDEVFSILPSKADEVSWVYIWNAVKKEVAEKQHLSGEALLNAAGKRFTEVVELTQVYDSVFSRSGLMRSKDTGVKMVTAFMAEPTTQINMLVDAHLSRKRGNKKQVAAIVGSLYASILVNAILKSIVSAARDDDDEFSYSEKYISNLISSFISDGSIVSSIPFARDIISLIQGYDVERMDMTVIADIVNSFRALGSDDKSTLDKITGIATSIFTLIGVPAKNIHKDIKAAFNLYRNIAEGYEFSENALKETIYREITGQSTPKADLLYNAIISGDTEYAERLAAKFETESGYNTAVRDGLKKYDTRIHDAAVARMNGNTAEYMRLAKEIIAEKNFSQDNIVAAINSIIRDLSSEKQEETPDKAKSIFTDADYFDAILGGDGKTAVIVGKDLVDTDVANGKTQDEAEKSLVSSLKNNVRDAFEAGEIDPSESKKILVNYCDMSDSEAENKVKFWDFKIDYPDYDLSEESVAKYNTEIKSSGISIETYYEYYVRQKACKGEVGSDGKTVSGSKKKQIMKVIDDLSLTNKQKDVLYFHNGWSESTLYEAPWH